MSYIHFKSKRGAIEVPEYSGYKIQKDWIDGKLPQKVEIENVDGGLETFLSAEISAIQTQKELDRPVKDNKKGFYDDNFSQWVEEQNELRELSSEEKARYNLSQILETALLCSGKTISREAKEVIHNKFVKFFEDNPNRILVNFDTHIEPFIKDIDKEISAFSLRILEVIGQACIRDKEYIV